MNRSVQTASLVCALWSTGLLAGGAPEHVPLPDGYSDQYVHYVTMNRVGKEQIAKMYANDVAIASYEKGAPAASGSVLVMEIYKPKKGDDGKALVGSDGTYEIGQLADALEHFRQQALDVQRLNLVEQLYGELREANAELQRMQARLVAQEKLAAYAEGVGLRVVRLQQAGDLYALAILGKP